VQAWLRETRRLRKGVFLWSSMGLVAPIAASIVGMITSEPMVGLLVALGFFGNVMWQILSARVVTSLTAGPLDTKDCRARTGFPSFRSAVRPDPPRSMHEWKRPASPSSLTVRAG
jgi:hypothetical protein